MIIRNKPGARTQGKEIVAVIQATCALTHRDSRISGCIVRQLIRLFILLIRTPPENPIRQ